MRQIIPTELKRGLEKHFEADCTNLLHVLRLGFTIVNRREGLDTHQNYNIYVGHISMLVKVYVRIRSFIVTCVLCICQIRQ